MLMFICLLCYAILWQNAPSTTETAHKETPAETHRGATAGQPPSPTDAAGTQASASGGGKAWMPPRHSVTAYTSDHCCSVILWSASCWSSCWSSGCRGVVNLWHCLFWAVNKNMFFFSVLRSTYSHWGCSSCHVVELLVKYWIIPVLVIARVLTLSQHSISVGSIWLDDLWSCGWPSVPALDMYSSLFTFSYLLFCCLCR